MNQEPFRLKDVQVYRTREATFCEILAALLTAGCWVAAIVRPETKHFIFSALCTFTVVYILTATYRPKLLFMGQKPPRNIQQLRIEIRFARILAVMIAALFLSIICLKDSVNWLPIVWVVLVLAMHVYKEVVNFINKKRD